MISIAIHCITSPHTISILTKSAFCVAVREKYGSSRTNPYGAIENTNKAMASTL